jgi:beta-glucosidase
MLTDVLKNEWQHKGFVVSDLGGVRTMVEGHAAGRMTYVDAVAQSVMAGCDFSDREFETHIPAAVREGKLTEARSNDALTRVLRVRFRLGEFDPQAMMHYSRIAPEVIDSAKHRATALKAAQQSIVLLQNRDHFLPLDRTKLKRIAVLGPLADQIIMNNYSGKAGQTVTPLQGIEDRAAPGTEILHARGCFVVAGGKVRTQVDTEPGFSGGASVKLEADATGEYIQFAVEVPAPGSYEIALQYKSFPERGIFQLSIDGVDQGQPVDMYAAAGGYGKLARFGTKAFTKAGVKQLRFAVTGRNAGSTSFAGHFDKLLLGDARELGFEMERLTFSTGGRDDRAAIAQAAALAREADIALVFVGTTAAVEHEGRDRQSLGLSGSQEALVQAVFAANPRTVVVQMSAGPLTVPWLAWNLPAMLQAWWPGEEGGHAIADVLFGEVNPAGRLPHTVYAAESQVPPLDEYDISQGFTYMYVNGAPLFAFGHGLSYTEFKYSNLRLAADKIAASGEFTVRLDLENTGPRAGDEVVQLYTHAVAPSVKRPAKELRGFQRVTLKPGEKRPIEFVVPAGKLAFWDETQHRFVVEPGAYQIMVGASSSDLRGVVTATVVAQKQ